MAEEGNAAGEWTLSQACFTCVAILEGRVWRVFRKRCPDETGSRDRAAARPVWPTSFSKVDCRGYR
jgi:hypothetical protein